MRDFLGAVLPAQGPYRLLQFFSGRKPVTHWADTLDGLSELAESAAGKTDIYFGTASYKDASSGEADNVRLNKALRLDIDAGETKWAKHKGEGVYRTQREALLAIKDFTSATRLKPSYILSSGTGLHIYYVLEEELAPVRWREYAARLHELCTVSSLQVDSTVTQDVTRILRVPGTLHKEGGTVRVLAGIGTPISLETLDSLLPERPEFDEDDMALTDAFLDDMRAERDYPPSSAFKIANQCGALREVVDAGGDVPEPKWRAMIGLVKHTVEGDEQVHDWSQGYEGYDWYETQRKIDGWKLGPTTCEEFSKHSDACRSCPHRSKVKSPIQLGQLNDDEQAALPPEQQTTLAEPPPPEDTGDAWDGLLPPGARVERDDSGRPSLQFRVQQSRTDENGQPVTSSVWVPVSTSIFWFSQWGEATTASDSAQASLCVWLGTHVARYDIDQTVLASQAELIKALASKAVHITTHQLAPKAAFTYAKTQYMHIQHMHRNLRVTDRFGMRILDSGELVSVHGKYTIHGDGTIRDTILNTALRSQADAYPLPLPPTAPGREFWGPEVWDSHIIPAARKHVAFLNKHYGSPESLRYQLSIMLAIASPLMPFVTGNYKFSGNLPGMSAISVSLYSKDGGYGKTTACQVGALAYGDPSKITRGQGNSAATDKARLARLALAGTMPTVMDEMGSLNPKQVYELLSNVANGSDRERLRPDGSIIDGVPWSLINTITTNRSLQELLQAGGAADSDAVPKRILEINVGDMPKPERDQRAEFTRDYSAVVSECAGALGAVIERELARLGVAGSNALVQKWVEKADSLVQGDVADRFFYRALGAMLSAYSILAPLQLAPFNPGDVAREFIKAFKASAEVISGASARQHPLELLNRCIADLAPWTVITEGEVLRSGAGRFDVVLNARLPDIIKGRYVKGQGRLYLSADAVQKWSMDQGASLWEMVTAAINVSVVLPSKRGVTTARQHRRSLTRGLQVETNQQVYVYAIDMWQLQSLLDDRAGIPLELRDLPPQAEVVDLTAERAARETSKALPVMPPAPPPVESKASGGDA